MISDLSSTPPEKFKLHAIVLKKDFSALKKKLVKKKVIDQLSSLNENQQTALHLAIQLNDATSVELLVQAHITHLDKTDVHVTDANGQTPLHAAAES